MGIPRLDANLYGVLSSANVSTVVGIRGGALEEAYFWQVCTRAGPDHDADLM